MDPSLSRHVANIYSELKQAALYVGARLDERPKHVPPKPDIKPPSRPKRPPAKGPPPPPESLPSEHCIVKTTSPLKWSCWYCKKYASSAVRAAALARTACATHPCPNPPSAPTGYSDPSPSPFDPVFPRQVLFQNPLQAFHESPHAPPRRHAPWYWSTPDTLSQGSLFESINRTSIPLFSTPRIKPTRQAPPVPDHAGSETSSIKNLPCTIPVSPNPSQAAWSEGDSDPDESPKDPHPQPQLADREPPPRLAPNFLFLFRAHTSFPSRWRDAWRPGLARPLLSPKLISILSPKLTFTLSTA